MGRVRHIHDYPELFLLSSLWQEEFPNWRCDHLWMPDKLWRALPRMKGEKLEQLVADHLQLGINSMFGWGEICLGYLFFVGMMPPPPEDIFGIKDKQ